MPSFARGHLLIYLPPSPVFRNSLQLALFGGVQRQSVCYRRRVLGLGLIWRLAGGRKTSSAEGRPATVNAGQKEVERKGHQHPVLSLTERASAVRFMSERTRNRGWLNPNQPLNRTKFISI